MSEGTSGEHTECHVRSAGGNGLIQQPDEVGLVLIDELQDLRVRLGELLQDGLQECGVLLDELPQGVELRVLSEEVERTASRGGGVLRGGGYVASE